MYEVRPEGTFHRVDSDTSLARAISKAEAIATTNKRRYVVVKVETVHVAEPGVVEVLPPVLPYAGKSEYIQGPDSAAPGDFTRPDDWPKEIDGQRAKPAPVVTDLVVTRNGVPVEDQAEGLRQFKAAASVPFKCVSCSHTVNRLGDSPCSLCEADEDVQSLMDRDRE